MDLSILIIEDEDVHYQRLESILDALPADHKKGWRINGINKIRAVHAEQAFNLIQEAHTRQRPFDVIVLDLAIPRYATPPGKKPEPHEMYGFRVLDVARELRVARQIVIYTQFKSDPNILRALRSGATDFVQKPRPSENNTLQIQDRFMACWQRVLEDISVSLLDERIRNLVPYAEAGLAQRYTACFSRFLQQVANTAEDVQHYAVERFGLDPAKDSQDYLIRSLKNQGEDLKAAQENWERLNADLLNGTKGELAPSVSLGDLLDSIHKRWSACLLVKNCDYQNTITDADAEVLTFQHDVSLIIQEIIAGALMLLPDFGAKRTLQVSAKVNGDAQAAIQFTDDVTPAITPEDARIINEGLVLGPNHGPKRFGRAWGLSVIQHLALRGGGRLIVQPRSDGTTITYFAPLDPNRN